MDKIDYKSHELANALKEALGAKDIQLIESPIISYKEGSNLSLMAVWSLNVSPVEIFSKDRYFDKISEFFTQISEKITVGEVAKLRREKESLQKKIDELNQEIVRLTPYKNYAEVAKEINGAKNDDI